MRKYIIFKADKGEPGWKERVLQHTQGLTDILTEHFDSTDGSFPEPGYRPPQFVRDEGAYDPSFHGYSTHFRASDWEVTRVEIYEHEIGRPYAEYDAICICFCKYNPIDAPLKPMPPRQVSVDSFGGDREAYDRWLESQEQPAEV